MKGKRARSRPRGGSGFRIIPPLRSSFVSHGNTRSNGPEAPSRRTGPSSIMRDTIGFEVIQHFNAGRPERKHRSAVPGRIMDLGILAHFA